MVAYTESERVPSAYHSELAVACELAFCRMMPFVIDKFDGILFSLRLERLAQTQLQTQLGVRSQHINSLLRRNGHSYLFRQESSRSSFDDDFALPIVLHMKQRVGELT